MKREDILKAKELDARLHKLECERHHFENIGQIYISSAYSLTLKDYPTPSDIGDCFRATKTAILFLIARQTEAARHELEKLGIQP